MIWLDGEKVGFGSELMGSLDLYGVYRGSLLLLTRPNHSEIFSGNYDWNIWTYTLLVGYVNHSKDVPGNQYTPP